jgi:hypothetical protein
VKLVRKGTRIKKLETVQLWRCTACARVFTPSPAALRHKTYPLAVILDGITLYNLGHTLAKAAAKLKSRHGHTIAPSTLAGWIDEHRDLATYGRLRDAGRRLTLPAQTIRTVKLYHRQVYEYAYHRPKLALLLAESAEHARVTGGLASSSKRCRKPVRTTSSPRACGRRRPPPILSTARASPRAARRTSPPAPRRCSFPPSATITGGTRRCSASCSPMTP